MKNSLSFLTPVSSSVYISIIHTIYTYFSDTINFFGRFSEEDRHCHISKEINKNI